ncbi:MAG: prepilin-type N-terminal cleavage/methylation domain-containing protein [Planctomycetota bacterium]|jgi:prepilin-type N-terminal cleavage/methylation domain-containing protein/prepilin-type processing-associated H-X9-DG protein
MQKQTIYNDRSGFTLIEILVVVAIIALLMTILLPSLKNAREQARAVMCGSQLNQIFVATLTYAQHNKDMIPYYGWYDDRGNRFAKHWWPTQVAMEVGNQFEMFTCPSDREPYDIEVVFKGGKIYMYRLGGQNLWKNEKPPLSPVTMDLSYRGACDTLIEYNERRGNKTYHLPRKVTNWRRPARSMLLIEANAITTPPVINGNTIEYRECFRFEDILEGINFKSGRIDPRLLRQYPHLRTWLRHNGKTNLLFMDSHVERLRPQQVRKIAKQQEHKYIPAP